MQGTREPQTLTAPHRGGDPLTDTPALIPLIHTTKKGDPPPTAKPPYCPTDRKICLQTLVRFTIIMTQSQLLELEPVSPLAAPQLVTHIVTLRHPVTGDEQTFEIKTTSDRFVDVYREICWQRAEQRLFGYEIFETIDLNHPF